MILTETHQSGINSTDCNKFTDYNTLLYQYYAQTTHS